MIPTPALPPDASAKSLPRVAEDDDDIGQKRRLLAPVTAPTARTKAPRQRKRQTSRLTKPLAMLLRWNLKVKLRTHPRPLKKRRARHGAPRLADVGVIRVTNASNRRSPTYFAKARKFSYRSRKNQLPKKARALLRTSLCRAAI